MKKLILSISLFSAAIVIADVVILYDTAPAKTLNAKYSMGQQKNLGIFPSGAMQPGPKLFKIECISQSEKDCPQSAAVIPAVYSIPEPSTLALLAFGLLGFVWRRR